MDGINLPPPINYWMNATSKHDCFFVVGPEPEKAERIGAFKIFLMGHSEVLRNLLEESNLSEKGDIPVIDCEPTTFRYFLIAVYGGMEAVLENIGFEQSLSLLYLFEKYLMLNFKEQISVHMTTWLVTDVNKLDDEQISDILETFFLALSYPISYESENILEKEMSRFLRGNVKEVLNHALFLEISPEALLWIVKQHSSIVSVSDIMVWQAALKWAKRMINSDDGNDLKECLKRHLKYIRFNTMSSEEFCTKVVPVGILTSEEVLESCLLIGTKSFKETTEVPPCVSTVKVPESFSLSFTVTNFLQLTGSEYSTVHKSRNFSWSVLVRKPGSYKEPMGFGFFLKCKPSANINKNWKCSASADLVLVNQDDKTNHSKSIKHLFCENQNDWGFSYFYLWEDLINVSNGFIKNNNVVVLANVTIIN